MIQNVLVVGSGSAGLLAAITLRRKIPQLVVRVVRSPDIGTIGVGEGTTPNFPKHLFEYLGISRAYFYKAAQPTWKLGVRFLWGPRPMFDYGFAQALDNQWPDLPRANGYFCDDEFRCLDRVTAMMAHDRVWLRLANGAPDIQPWHGFHIENEKLVDTLEGLSQELNVQIIDGRVNSTERGPAGISAVMLEDGRRLEADFFIDCSGFRSELLGKALEEPFISYGKSLFCDRAVVGGWERQPNEPILPYTTAETMDAGWAWRIDHEHHVNRGYVYASQFSSDDDARAEFLWKNPRAAKDGRVVKFRSGRYQRAWVENVVALGNSAGFVEPLEATALMVVCAQSRMLAELLPVAGFVVTPTMRDLYNNQAAATWDDIRNFLSIHYKFNTRLDTPFWRHCLRETDVSELAGLLEFYAQNGPTGFARHLLPKGASSFGMEGFLNILVGNRVPYAARYIPTDAERQVWNARCANFAQQGRAGMTVEESLAVIRQPNWQWNAET
jgi:tryptophan halogenase